jgi:hypothetical protein
MLKSRYQEIIIGMGLLSLVRGLISCKRNRSTLLIDDPRFEVDSYQCHFLSEFEIQAFLRLGEKYNIEELQELKQFFIPAQIEYCLSNIRLKLGSDPYTNLIEVLRKFPELLDDSDLDLIYKESPVSFNNYFFEELKRYEDRCFNSNIRNKNIRFELQGPKWFKIIFQRFSQLINGEFSATKSLKFAGLLHLLSLSSEEKIKAYFPPEEILYQFFRMLSPIYRLQDYFLLTQLKRRLLLSGGDYKQSSVQYWQFHQKKFENLLLASFEGVISGERVLFFAYPPDDVPFKLSGSFPVLKKYQLSPLKRNATSRPAQELIFFAEEAKLGADTPYRLLTKSQDGISYYHWPYPDLPGSKAEFYGAEMMKDQLRDFNFYPIPINQVEPKSIQSVTLDLRSLRDYRKSENFILAQLPLDVVVEGQSIQGFEYWGHFRYRGLGLLALCYGVEGI